MIESVQFGEDPSDVIDSHLFESVARDALIVRKQIRKQSPRLYQWLSEHGTLHDFALDMAAGKILQSDGFVRKYKLPKSIESEVKALLM